MSGTPLSWEMGTEDACRAPGYIDVPPMTPRMALATAMMTFNTLFQMVLFIVSGI